MTMRFDRLTQIKISFDVYETTLTDNGENGESSSSTPSVSDADMLTALQVYPFVVIQDRATGAFEEYIIHRLEEPKMADIKRSLVKDLNPVIDVSTSGQVKVKAGIQGELLLQVMEDDMNGIHHALFMLKRNAGGAGVHETQHIRSFVLDAQPMGVGASRSGVPTGDTEPAIDAHAE
jgi:hypothetical protein